MSKVTSSTGNSANADTTDYESQVYNDAMSALADILPSINTIDATTKNAINSEIEAYMQSGVNNINNEYNSELSDLQDNSASRFGNLDNSMFLDGLGNLQNERASAVGDFANQAQSKEADLVSNALDKNYSYVDLLTQIINDYYNNADTLSKTYSNLKSSNTSSSSSSSSGNSSPILSNSDIKTILSTLSSFT